MADHFFLRKIYHIDRRKIAYLRFILEGYDGLCFLRTLDPAVARIEISYSPTCRDDAENLLAALERETDMSPQEQS